MEFPMFSAMDEMASHTELAVFPAASVKSLNKLIAPVTKGSIASPNRTPNPVRISITSVTTEVTVSIASENAFVISAVFSSLTPSTSSNAWSVFTGFRMAYIAAPTAAPAAINGNKGATAAQAATAMLASAGIATAVIAPASAMMAICNSGGTRSSMASFSPFSLIAEANSDSASPAVLNTSGKLSASEMARPVCMAVCSTPSMRFDQAPSTVLLWASIIPA